jgi:ABC-type Na+ efflux pump permease subunit/membrane protease YdiL (CAAX protease family)
MTDNLARQGRLIRKELSEILRDRRTIITLVVMPLLLYPLLSVAFQQFILASRLTGQNTDYQIGFETRSDQEEFDARVRRGERALNMRADMSDKKKTDKGKSAAPSSSDGQPRINYVVGTADALETALRKGEIDASVRAVAPPANAAPKREGPDQVLFFEISYLSQSPGGQGVLAYLEERLAAVNEADLLRRLNVGIVQPPSRFVQLLRMPLDEAGASPMISLAALVPLILILMTITGAVYPAIDLTAGERERGTLEILVAAPVPRLGLLFAKYVSVVTVAVLTALINLVAMTMTLVLSGLGPVLFANQELTVGIIVQLFGLLLLFAAFFSAVLLCITSFARSFKEAQAYLIPLMLVSLGPGVMGMIPGLKLADWAWAPLVNIVLLGRDLFEGGAELGPTLLVIVSTVIYACAAIGLAAHIFGAESVLYNEQSSWADLFRRPAEPQPHAGVVAALWCLALMIPLNFVAQGTLLLLRSGELLSLRMLVFLIALHTLLVFGALPALFAWRGNLRWSSAFALLPARWPAYLGGVILGLSLWPVLFAAMIWLGANRLQQQPIEGIEEIIELYRSLPRSVRLALVIVPAVLEEWFFRGYLFGALRQRASAGQTILATALLFGLAHYVLQPKMGIERMWSSAFLGLVLGVMREASGSVWPGTLFHVCHNSFVILLLGEAADEEMTIETWWVLAGAAGSAVGAVLIYLGRSRRLASFADA